MSSRKKWTLLALLCIIQTAVPQTFSFKNWYAFSNATVTDADECGTIKKVVARMNNWSPAQFQILMDGVALGEENLVSKTTDVYFEGDGNGNPAWRVRMDNSGESWSYTFFINTRVTPYEIISTIPTDPFNSAKIESSKTVLTSPQEEFSLSGEGCSSADTATYAFQWVKSTDKKTWTDITNATTGQLESEKLSTDSMYYALKVRISYDEVDESGDTVKDAIHEVTSNIVLVSYQQPEVSFSASTGMNSHKFNETEFEVKESGSINMKASSASFTGNPTYVLQYKSLERASENVNWQDVATLPEGELTGFTPTVSAEYRIKAKGVSKYSGLETEVYSKEIIVVRKIYEVDTEKFAHEVLWYDDFGRFNGARTYIDAMGNTYTNSFKDESGKSYTIENYWAPDPLGYVKEHEYGAFDPNFLHNTRDWCSKYRLEDGYYIITNNPYNGDGKYNKADRDYWQADDHTAADENGAMLFVNCKGDLEGVKIYERQLSLNCELSQSKGVWVIFSVFVNNAVYKKGSDTPVNVRLEIVDPDGNVVYSISSGDINQRTGTLSADSWANLSFRFLAEAKDYTIRLYNNAPGGANWGNDILLDDISVTLCYPKIELVLHDESHATNTTACLGETFELLAYNEDGLDKYIGAPKYLYQYRNEQTEGRWTDYGKISNDNILKVKVSSELVGGTRFRVIAAADESVVRTIGDGKEVELSCTTVYAIDDGMFVDIGKPFELTISLSDSLLCFGADSILATAVPDDTLIHPSKYFWYQGGLLADSTEANLYTFARSNIENLFDAPGDYEFEVRAIDDLCQQDISKKKWADGNRSSVAILPHNKLRLSTDETTLSWGESFSFDIDNDGYQGDTLILHEIGGLTKDSVIENKSGQIIHPSQNGEVSYFLSAPESALCVDPSDTAAVNISLLIPNLITPHNDMAEEMNNTFLYGLGFRVEVFNRYQQLIFEGDNGWNGRYKNESGDLVEPGTYYYRLFLPNGDVRKGTIEVGKFK